jgi:hypothetical protein
MIARSRLDPFTTRLLAINQKRRSPAVAAAGATAPPTQPPAVAPIAACGSGYLHEPEEPEELEELEELEEPQEPQEPEEPLALSPAQPEVNTGCAECGGKRDPIADLRQEVAELRKRLGAVEAHFGQQEPDSPQFMSLVSRE